MAIALREDLCFCLTDRCAIFLDLAANRYFGLTGSTDLALRRIIAGDALEPGLERALRPLFAKGLICDVDQAGPLSPVTNAAPETSLHGAVLRATTGDTIRALSLYVRIVTEMRIAGLKTVVRRRQLRKTQRPLTKHASERDNVVQQVLAAHRRADQLIGSADRCLARSLALIDHLAARGAYPDLVIGIRTSAFSAHCWVQQGQTLLNDELDRVRLFTPIFVL